MLTRHRTRALCAIVCGALLVQGCAPGARTYGDEPGPAFRSFANSPDGICTAERAELERQGTRIEANLRPLPSASTSAAAGYIARLQATGVAVLEMLRRVLTDVETENRWIGWTIDAFDDLEACRRAAAAAVRGDVSAGRLDQATAEGRLAQIRQDYAADVERFATIGKAVAENTTTYVDVYSDLAADNAGEAIELKPYTPPEDRGEAPSAVVAARPAVKTVTPPSTLTATSPQPAVRPEIVRLQQELLTNVRKRDEIIDRVRTAEAGDVDEVLDLSSVQPRHRRTA